MSITFLTLFSRKTTYYVIIVDEIKYDSITNTINNSVYYFGVAPKRKTKGYLEKILTIADTSNSFIREVKQNFEILNIYFPIYQSSNEDFFQIDVDIYKKNGMIQQEILTSKNNMLFSSLYYCLNDLEECSKTDQTIIRIVEINGPLKFLDPEVIPSYKRSNRLALLNLKKMKDGDKVFTTAYYNQMGILKKIEKDLIKCSFLFQAEQIQKNSVLDFNGKVLKDTILYKNIKIDRS